MAAQGTCAARSVTCHVPRRAAPPRACLQGEITARRWQITGERTKHFRHPSSDWCGHPALGDRSDSMSARCDQYGRHATTAHASLSVFITQASGEISADSGTFGNMMLVIMSRKSGLVDIRHQCDVTSACQISSLPRADSFNLRGIRTMETIVGLL